MPGRDVRGQFWVMVIDADGRRVVEEGFPTFEDALAAALDGRASDGRPRWIAVVGWGV